MRSGTLPFLSSASAPVAMTPSRIIAAGIYIQRPFAGVAAPGASFGLLFPRFSAARKDLWSGILNLEFWMRPTGSAVLMC
jgi:hypothetical protein